MDPHQSKGPQPAESISKVKVKRSSAWITRVNHCKKSKKNEVRLQQMSSLESNICLLESFQDSVE